MKTRKSMTEEVRNKINSYIKNKIDISEIIEPYIIKNEFLANAIIKKFDRMNEDLQNINFVNCVFGDENNILNFTGCNLQGSNFQSSRFLGKVSFRSCDLRNCNFNDAFMPEIQYQFADLRNISCCDAVMKIGSKCGYKAKVDFKLFENFIKYLQLDITK